MSRSRAQTPRRVALIAFDGAQILDITGPLQFLAGANEAKATGAPPYVFELVAPKAGPIVTSCGLQLVADRAIDTAWLASLDDLHTLMVAGGEGTGDAIRDRHLIAAIRSAARKAKRVVSICSGAFLLAAAGLLDGRRVATHWNAVAALKKNFPKLKVDDDAIYVRDGKFWTSAGVTAGMDLTLALIREDLGHETALAVARRHVVFMIRSGGQAQFSVQLAAQANPKGRLAQLLAWIPDHLDEKLSAPALAHRAAMSERTFVRAFRRETGATPARFVEQARLEAARRSLSAGGVGVEQVARDCGFGSAERMRRSFQRHFKVSPQDYRARFGSAPVITQGVRP